MLTKPSQPCPMKSSPKSKEDQTKEEIPQEEEIIQVLLSRRLSQLKNQDVADLLMPIYLQIIYPFQIKLWKFEP